jgi:hypothetical protein
VARTKRKTHRYRRTARSQPLVILDRECEGSHAGLRNSENHDAGVDRNHAVRTIDPAGITEVGVDSARLRGWIAEL